MPTLAELARFAAAAYGDPIPDPSHWRALEPCRPNGVDYYGQAYVNDQTKQIVITNRGTRPTSLQDLMHDAQLTLHVENAGQIEAKIYAESIYKNYPDYSIIEVGHSLGGNVAQAAIAYLVDKHGAQHVSGVLFNAPGIGGAPHQSPASYNVLNVVSRGDGIQLAGGEHLGTELTIDAGPDTAKLAFNPGPLVYANPALGGLIHAGLTVFDLVGPGHSIKTQIAYLEGEGRALGSTQWYGPISGGGSDAGNVNVVFDSSGTSLTVDTPQVDHLITFDNEGAPVSTAIYAVQETDSAGTTVNLFNNGTGYFGKMATTADGFDPGSFWRNGSDTFRLSQSSSDGASAIERHADGSYTLASYVDGRGDTSQGSVIVTINPQTLLLQIELHDENGCCPIDTNVRKTALGMKSDMLTV